MTSVDDIASRGSRMEWVVSLETAGDPSARFADDAHRLALALAGRPAAVELREHGYGATVLVGCDDPQEALSLGLRTLRDAERRVGLTGLPLVSAEVTAAAELDEAAVPPRVPGVVQLDDGCLADSGG